MRVRPATASDTPGILPMVRALCSLHERHDPERFKVLPDVVERYASWLPERAEDPRSVLLVAEDGAGALIGFLVGTIEPEVPIFWIPECGWIHDIWVEPHARRHGVAKALVNAAAARFAELGQKQVRLHTAMFNDAARTVFGEAGFRPCVVEMLRTVG
ncbi:MAG TPA: GNAT family N-acetyltransferase [Phycisphaerales bacterium]|nr:GNAT family N-acetyltransferase [Phycisphaerales bacterium]